MLHPILSVEREKRIKLETATVRKNAKFEDGPSCRDGEVERVGHGEESSEHLGFFILMGCLSARFPGLIKIRAGFSFSCFAG